MAAGGAGGRVVEARCAACGAAADPAGVLYTCEACGGTVDLLYDYPRIARELDAAGEAADAAAALAPSPPAGHHARAVLRPAPRLAADLGLADLALADDTGQPSGSLKDRASEAVLQRAVELGLGTVACASTGNAAASLACLAPRFGLAAVVFVPRAAPPAKLRQMQVHGARVVLVDGNYDRAYDLCLEACRQRGWYSRNTAHNPWCGEGKKSVVTELAAPGRRRLADWIFVPTGDGCLLGGAHKGLTDLARVGRLDGMPRLAAVQAEGSAAIAAAWRDGLDAVRPVRAATVADSLAVDLPRDGHKALRALRETDGMAVTVSDGEILQAQLDLARREGIFAEPAGAAALAGLRRALADGSVDPGGRVLVLVTGHGLKDPEAPAPLLEAPPVIASLADLP